MTLNQLKKEFFHWKARTRTKECGYGFYWKWSDIMDKGAELLPFFLNKLSFIKVKKIYLIQTRLV